MFKVIQSSSRKIRPLVLLPFFSLAMLIITQAFAVFATFQFAVATPLQLRTNSPVPSKCRRASVVVLGAGISGITAAQAMSNASMSDFIIVDVNSYIGGRVAHTTFGKDPAGNPYTVELGANWV